MTHHRILSVPACQIRKGDVILVYKNIEYNMGSFSRSQSFMNVDRESVVNHHLDPADGTYYIQTDSGVAAYLDPHDHLQLDCLETFGQNQGNGAF